MAKKFNGTKLTYAKKFKVHEANYRHKRSSVQLT